MTVRLPKVAPTKTATRPKVEGGFPLEHYSYSTFTKLSTNPIMFKINAINGDSIDTTVTASNVLGRAAHKAMQTYFGANPEVPTPDEYAGQAGGRDHPSWSGGLRSRGERVSRLSAHLPGLGESFAGFESASSRGGFMPSRAAASARVRRSMVGVG